VCRRWLACTRLAWSSVAVALLAGACASGGRQPSAEQSERTQQFERLWASLELTTPADALSATELTCIGALPDRSSVSPDEPRFGNTDVPMPVVFAAFDACLTTANRERFITADLLARTDMGVTEETAACLAPGFVAIAEQHGLAAALHEPTETAAEAVETTRLECGVIGPSRRFLARYVTGLFTLDDEILPSAFCPGAFTDAEVVGLAERLSALDPADRPTDFRLASRPDEMPETWTVTVLGQPTTVALTLRPDDSYCVEQVDTDQDDLRLLLTPV